MMVVSSTVVHWFGTKQDSFSFSISMYEEFYFQPTRFYFFFLAELPSIQLYSFYWEIDSRNKEDHLFRIEQKDLFKFSIQLIESELKIALIISVEKSSSNFLRTLLECIPLHYTTTSEIAQWDHFPHGFSVSIYLKCIISRNSWSIFVQQKGIQTHIFIYH